MATMQTIEAAQDKVLKIFADKAKGYYLAGGTALSKYYFQHRQSVDLDFFTKEFNSGQIQQLISLVAREETVKIELLNISQKEDFAKFAMYLLVFTQGVELKLDFVEDYISTLKPFNLINGINVLSLEDIYLRKLFAAAGTVSREDEAGKLINLEGRQEAKDFFDLYFLSTTFQPLASFVKDYGNNQIKEGIVRWFRSYDRIAMKSGLLDIKTKIPIDYRIAENHFRIEIDNILEAEIGEI